MPYRSVVESQRPGASEWSCDSLLLLRFSPELLRALREVVPVPRGSPTKALAPLAANEAVGAIYSTVTTMTYTEVARAQDAYQAANGEPSRGLAAVVSQMEGHRAQGLFTRFVFWESTEP
jgi:hypothetical protein